MGTQEVRTVAFRLNISMLASVYKAYICGYGCLFIGPSFKLFCLFFLSIFVGNGINSGYAKE